MTQQMQLIQVVVKPYMFPQAVPLLRVQTRHCKIIKSKLQETRILI